MIEQPTGLFSAFASRMRDTHRKVATSGEGDLATRDSRDIGPIGTAARLVLGVFLVGIIMYGQLAGAGHLSPITWILGLIVFPALVLAWHFWRVLRNPARFHDTSPLSFVLSIVLPLAFYLVGLYMSALWFTSDATLIFVGSSMILAALRGTAGCEFLVLSNWLLRRTDQLACAVWTPIDSLEQRDPRS
jgi:hypothetical protein